VLASGTSIGPVGQQHHDAVKAVTHHSHVQGSVPRHAGAVHVAAPLQQQASHLRGQIPWSQLGHPEQRGHGTWALSLPP
jgi:hypothetical protein